jgi:hypothetical protein
LAFQPDHGIFNLLSLTPATATAYVYMYYMTIDSIIVILATCAGIQGKARFPCRHGN